MSTNTTNPANTGERSTTMTANTTNTPKIGDEIVVDMSKMVGFDDYIATGNNGHDTVIVKVTQVDDHRSYTNGKLSGFGVCRALTPIGGRMIYWDDGAIIEDEEAGDLVRHVDGLVWIGA